MCADLLNMERDINVLKENGIEYLHVDVMDGHFVRNLTFGVDFVRTLHERFTMPLDIHLMVENPEEFIPRLELRRGDILSVHSELNLDFEGMSRDLRSKGVKFGVAVNPETEITTIKKLIPKIDCVILMLVHPGYAGATLVPGILDKVGQMRRLLDANGGERVLISVDGSVNCERAEQMALMGANIFVGGTAGIYRKGMELCDTIPEFRMAINH